MGKKIFLFIIAASILFFVNILSVVATCTKCDTANCGSCSTTIDKWKCSCTGLISTGVYTTCSGITNASCCSSGKVLRNGNCYTLESESKTEYKCSETNCGNKIEKRTCSRSKYCLNDNECESFSTWTCGATQIFETCANLKKCQGENGQDINSWTTTQPSCQCSGSCYPAPDLKDLDDSSLSPKNVFDGNKLKLPINIGWKALALNECSVGSYQYEISGPTTFSKKVIVFCSTIEECRVIYDQAEQDGNLEIMNKTHAIADNIRRCVTNPTGEECIADSGPTYNYATKEYDYYLSPQNQDVVRDDSKKDEEKGCILKSDADYSWKVRACLDSEGTDCGEPSKNETFSTSPVPELIMPYDPDWQGSLEANPDIPVTFLWCASDKASSYYFSISGYGETLPFSISKKNGILPNQIIIPQGTVTSYINYDWKIASCLNENSAACGNYSQNWNLNAKEAPIPSPTIISPKNFDVVNFSTNLRWELVGTAGASSYRYEIKKGGVLIFSSVVPGGTNSVSFESFWNNKLKYDTTYNLELKSCWDNEGEKCQNEGSKISFKTTGAVPELVSPTSNAQNVFIPTKLVWKGVPGALSYNFKITEPNFSDIVQNSETSVDYQHLKQNTSYSWQVRTCADKNGKACGSWSVPRQFSTITLVSPNQPNPENGNNLTFFQRQISWEVVSGANFYQYSIDYSKNNPPSDEVNENCKTLTGKSEVQTAIVDSNSASLPLECLGNYTWKVKSCLDDKCAYSSNWSEKWSFNLVQVAGTGSKGLIPCGMSYDDPKTPWNERESCQLKHIFLLVKNIIDFVLWRLSLIILVVLILIVGATSYFSFGSPDVPAKAKALLKAAGIGFAIIFGAWLIVNWILILLGYQSGIFGKWWQIIF